MQKQQKFKVHVIHQEQGETKARPTEQKHQWSSVQHGSERQDGTKLKVIENRHTEIKSGGLNGG